MIVLWEKLKGYAAALGLILAAIGIAFLKGRKAGVQHIETEQARKRDALQQDYDEIDNRGISPADAYSKLRERSRDRGMS